MNVTETTGLSSATRKTIDTINAVRDLANGGSSAFGTLALISDGLAYLIGQGLAGDYSAKTLVKAQAVSDALQCLFLIQMGFHLNQVEFLGFIWHAIHASDISCKLHKWYFNFTPNMCALFAMLISLDRALAIKLPVFYKKHGTGKNARLFVVIPVVILALVSSFPNFLINSLTSVCHTNQQHSWSELYYDVVNYSYLCVIPVIGLANIVVVHGMFKRKALSGSVKAVTWALITLSTAFSVSMIIYRVCVSLAQTKNHSDPVLARMVGFWYALANMTTAVNSAITAPIYLTMASMRRALKRSIGIKDSPGASSAQ